MNCQFNYQGHAVYPAAALGIVHDYKGKQPQQWFFGGGKTSLSVRKQADKSTNGHSDDVTALCVSYSRKLVASGQNGQCPAIFLWSADQNTQMLSKKRLRC